MFDENSESGSFLVGSISICNDDECQHKDIKMERFGSCRFSYCSCSGFKYSNDAQWCDNCGHSRAMHIH